MSNDVGDLLAPAEEPGRHAVARRQRRRHRLGWLDVAERMRDEAADLRAWADAIDADRIVLLGMGGSSLGPEVLRAAIGSDRLIVLDTTDPATVASTPLGNSFFLVSSKSGTTLEVHTLLAHCWERVPDASRYAAITDPGTPLATLASERGFNRLFENPPDIGGRYSVLSYFGLVPAALLGYDVAALCERALDSDRRAAVERGVAMGEAAPKGATRSRSWCPSRSGTSGCGSSSSSPSPPASGHGLRARADHRGRDRDPTATSSGSSSPTRSSSAPSSSAGRWPPPSPATCWGSTRSTSRTSPSRSRTPPRCSSTCRCRMRRATTPRA